ncbi:hypothetical protein PF003_g5278 [Phytophthora fragariae]|nr:hypothetical protein PF003_g5278 [Phytophthora fragariae]
MLRPEDRPALLKTPPTAQTAFRTKKQTPLRHRNPPPAKGSDVLRPRRRQTSKLNNNPTEVEMLPSDASDKPSVARADPPQPTRPPGRSKADEEVPRTLGEQTKTPRRTLDTREDEATS